MEKKKRTIAERLKEMFLGSSFDDINLEIQDRTTTLDSGVFGGLFGYERAKITCGDWEDEAGNYGLMFGFEDGSRLSVSIDGEMEASLEIYRHIGAGLAAMDLCPENSC